MRQGSSSGALLAAAFRCASNTFVPDCIPSTSYACSALLAPWTRGSSTSTAVASPQVQQQPNLDLEYARRINEMLAAQAARQKQEQHQQQLQILEQQRRRLDLDSIPTLQLPGRQQQQQQQQDQRRKQQQQQPDIDKPAVDWRQIVERVRQTGQAVTGQQMLTDKFRWASGS